MKIVDITVLMPVYNGAEYIREAIDSVLGQTFENFELLIIDDGSSDNSIDIIKSYSDPRIILIKNNYNIGLVKTLNKGLDNAKGEFIARIDQDDVCYPERLERQLDFIRNNPEIILLGSGCMEIDKDGNEIAVHQYPSNHRKLFADLLKLKAFFPHSSAFFNKCVVTELGGYNFNLNGAEDCDLWLRIASVGKIACFPEPLIKLRKHSTSMTAKNLSFSISLKISACVCQLLRTAMYNDPSNGETEEWKIFFEWVDKKIKEEKIINEILIIQRLREINYSRENNFFLRKILFLISFFKLSNKYRIIKLKIFGTNIVNDLTYVIISNRLFQKKTKDDELCGVEK